MRGVGSKRPKWLRLSGPHNQAGGLPVLAFALVNPFFPTAVVARTACASTWNGPSTQSCCGYEMGMGEFARPDVASRCWSRAFPLLILIFILPPTLVSCLSVAGRTILVNGIKNYNYNWACIFYGAASLPPPPHCWPLRSIWPTWMPLSPKSQSMN